MAHRDDSVHDRCEYLFDAESPETRNLHQFHLREHPDVGPLIYVDFLPSALAEGRYRAAPDPLVMGQGLDRIPAAMAAHQKAVSAKKLVVTL